MNRTVLLSTRAAQDYARLPVGVRAEVTAALTNYAGARGGATKLLRGVEDGPDLVRLRVGGYRVVFDESDSTLRVTGIFCKSSERPSRALGSRTPLPQPVVLSVAGRAPP